MDVIDWKALPDPLTPAEVAALFRVGQKQASRWCADGRLQAIRTPGGHRRIPKWALRDAMEALR